MFVPAFLLRAHLGGNGAAAFKHRPSLGAEMFLPTLREGGTADGTLPRRPH
jgi:hypothetical protein